jgi:hypothetical protein
MVGDDVGGVTRGMIIEDGHLTGAPVEQSRRGGEDVVGQPRAPGIPVFRAAREQLPDGAEPGDPLHVGAEYDAHAARVTERTPTRIDESPYCCA